MKFLKILFVLVLYVCTARNIRGQAFTASDISRQIARGKALDACRAGSFLGCYISRCRKG